MRLRADPIAIARPSQTDVAAAVERLVAGECRAIELVSGRDGLLRAQRGPGGRLLLEWELPREGKAPLLLSCVGPELGRAELNQAIAWFANDEILRLARRFRWLSATFVRRPMTAEEDVRLWTQIGLMIFLLQLLHLLFPAPRH